MIDKHILLKKYFEANHVMQSNIASYDGFVEWRLQKLIDEIKEAVPAVIPPEAEEVKFVFGSIKVEKPSIVEADGAKRKILPSEARIRNLTYAAPIYLEISLLVDGKERERTDIEIGQLPVMLKSKLCYLYGLTQKQLIAAGEDPTDVGGYFIINGTERVLSMLEDLAPNQIFSTVKKTGPVTHSATIYSASDMMKLPHKLERMKDGTLALSFASFKRVPVVALIKALGFTKDSDIPRLINITGADEEIYTNLFDFLELKTEDEAKDYLAKAAGMVMAQEQRIKRAEYMIDNFLFPHVGVTTLDRRMKGYFLGRMVRKLLLLKQGKIARDDEDHYMNKRVRLSGDLLEDLFRQNLKFLINDMLYIFQRGVRRGKILTITAVVRNILTQRVKSAMATGNWAQNRQGVSQRLERENSLQTISHLQRVASLLESTRELFEARQLHPTHWGRLCPLESPEGKSIGLRKNLALLASITPETKSKDVTETLLAIEELGLKRFGAENE